MKKRLRKRKKIRGERVVNRCITDPTCNVVLCKGPDGVMRPLMRACRVYLDDTKMNGDGGMVYMDTCQFMPQVPMPNISGTIEFDNNDPKAEPMIELFEAFKREPLAKLREMLPDDIYDKLPKWAKEV